MSDLVQILPSLTLYGAPDKFTKWRPKQEAAILAAADSQKRFIFQSAPTGFGKSPVYVGQSLITGDRTIVLTSTKGLQTQLVDDFAGVGLVDIRGMNSYPCRAADAEFSIRANHEVTCEEGPCRAGLKCSMREAGCSYYEAYHTAQGGQLVVTNYAYWMTINRYGEGLGDFDLMIMDEGHNAPDELSDFLSVELENSEIEGVIGSTAMRAGSNIDDWRKWAVYHASKMEERLDSVVGKIRMARESGHRVEYTAIREASAVRRVLGKVKTIAGMKGEWVMEQQGKRYRFDPVWPAEYAEQVLFKGIKKVVVFSATIRPKTADILGIKPADRDFNEYPSTFPVARRPVIQVDTCQMNFRTTPEQLKKWCNRIDQIIQNRLDRKGIVQTVSFARRNLIMQESEFASLMYVNDPSNTRSVVEQFKKADPPAILVSPSVTTGYDFPYETCQYQIIGKIPFMDNRPAVIQARSKSDKDYTNYMAAQNLIQMAGRGMRAEDDICETIIIDDNIKWFIYRYKQFFPKWFMESYRQSATIPRPLELT